MFLRQLSSKSRCLGISSSVRTCSAGWRFFKRGYAAQLSNETATGVNYFKKGEDPPLKDDSEYPDWLWNIAETPPTLFRLQKQLEGSEVDDSNADLVKRMVKLHNNRKIKDENFIKGKK